VRPQDKIRVVTRPPRSGGTLQMMKTEFVQAIGSVKEAPSMGRLIHTKDDDLGMQRESEHN